MAKVCVCVCVCVCACACACACVRACVRARLTGAGVFIHSDEAWEAVAAVAAREVDAGCVGLAVVHLGGALVDI